MSVKPFTIFDHIKNITGDKKPWSDLSESDRKSYSNYMAMRILSMDSDKLEFLGDISKYIERLEPKYAYQVFIDYIPKDKRFHKYINPKSAIKYNAELLLYLSKYFEISQSEAIEYLDIMMNNEVLTRNLIALCAAFGLTEKEAAKLLKTNAK